MMYPNMASVLHFDCHGDRLLPISTLPSNWDNLREAHEPDDKQDSRISNT